MLHQPHIRIEHGKWHSKKLTATERRAVRRSPTFRFIVQPSFLRGLAHLFDFSGSLSAYSDEGLTARETDWLALSSDWQAIADDIRTAEKEFAAPHSSEERDGENTQVVP